jgi:hypothetical protein
MNIIPYIGTPTLNAFKTKSHATKVEAFNKRATRNRINETVRRRLDMDSSK